MNQYSILVRVAPGRTSLRVLAISPLDDHLVQVADDRRYSAPAPVVGQVVLAALLALHTGESASGIEEGLWEGLSDLW